MILNTLMAWMASAEAFAELVRLFPFFSASAAVVFPLATPSRSRVTDG